MLEQLIFVDGTRQVCGTGATPGALTGARHLYKCLLAQSEMLQCKVDVIMTTTIYFLFPTYMYL